MPIIASSAKLVCIINPRIVHLQIFEIRWVFAERILYLTQYCKKRPESRENINNLELSREITVKLTNFALRGCSRQIHCFIAAMNSSGKIGALFKQSPTAWQQSPCLPLTSEWKAMFLHGQVRWHFRTDYHHKTLSKYWSLPAFHWSRSGISEHAWWNLHKGRSIFCKWFRKIDRILTRLYHTNLCQDL